MGQIGYRCGSGQLRPILCEGRWFRAFIVEQAFLAEVRPTISHNWRSPLPLAPVVRPSNQGCITTNMQQVSPTDDFIPTARTAERRIININQTTASALGTTHIYSVCASPDWIEEGPTDAVPPSSSTPQATPAEIPPQYQPNHPLVFAQDDSLNHVATYQKLGNGKNVDVRFAIILVYIPYSMIVISRERGGVVLCHSHTMLINYVSCCSVRMTITTF